MFRLLVQFPFHITYDSINLIFENMYIFTLIIKSRSLRAKMIANKSYTALAKWRSWWSTVLHTKRLQVRSLVRAHTYVVGLLHGWGACRRQAIDVSLSHWCFSLPLFLSLPHSLSKINKHILGWEFKKENV